MPRNARKKSATGVYHVVTRGIGKQLLFEDDNDYYYFLRIMYKYKIEQGSKIYCYCLMDNHVHLLIYDSNGSIDQVMKKVGHVRNDERAALLYHLAHTAVEELGGTGSVLHKGNPAHTFED